MHRPIIITLILLLTACTTQPTPACTYPRGAAYISPDAAALMQAYDLDLITITQYEIDTAKRYEQMTRTCFAGLHATLYGDRADRVMVIYNRDQIIIMSEQEFERIDGAPIADNIDGIQRP